MNQYKYYLKTISPSSFIKAFLTLPTESLTLFSLPPANIYCVPILFQALCWAAV